MSIDEPRFQCGNCKHICTDSQMLGDVTVFDDGEEYWSNWICPKCGWWGNEPGSHHKSNGEDIWTLIYEEKE